MEKKVSFKLGLLVLLIGLLTALPVLADESNHSDQPGAITVNETTEIRPNLGPQGNGVVGEHGYKVFNPGAIKSTHALPLTSNAGDELGVTAIRRGSTDAWLAWVWSWDWKKWGWDHYGYHNSESDLSEEQIWADGRLKITTDSGWRVLCSDHKSGVRAECSTQFFQLLPRTIKAETNHHFHKSGYIDSDFKTSDSA